MDVGFQGSFTHIPLIWPVHAARNHIFVSSGALASWTTSPCKQHFKWRLRVEKGNAAKTLWPCRITAKDKERALQLCTFNAWAPTKRRVVNEFVWDGNTTQISSQVLSDLQDKLQALRGPSPHPLKNPHKSFSRSLRMTIGCESWKRGYGHTYYISSRCRLRCHPEKLIRKP